MSSHGHGLQQAEPLSLAHISGLTFSIFLSDFFSWAQGAEGSILLQPFPLHAASSLQPRPTTKHSNEAQHPPFASASCWILDLGWSSAKQALRSWNFGKAGAACIYFGTQLAAAGACIILTLCNCRA